MIDPQVYAQEMALLQGWFGKELNELVGAALFKSLTDQLSTEEFQSACRQIFQEANPSPFNFPCVKDFVERAQGSLDEKAADEWQIASDYSSAADLSQLTDAGRKALERIGGRHQLGMTNTDQLQWIRKTFISEYKSAARESRRKASFSSLAAGKTHLSLVGGPNAG